MLPSGSISISWRTDDMRCRCDNEAWLLTDAKGIPVAPVCDECEEKVRAKYNAWVFSGYDQSDCDEQIEEEPEIGGLR